MATTKVPTTIWAANTVSAGVDETSGVVNLADGYGATLFVKITNGATGPTTPAQVQMESSPDNINWFAGGTLLRGTTTNSDVQSWEVPLDMSKPWIRLVVTAGVAQDVTLDAYVSETTAV